MNVHAKVAVGAHDHPQRERLCRYLLRLPPPQDRLALGRRVGIGVEAAWKDGRSARMKRASILGRSRTGAS